MLNIFQLNNLDKLFFTYKIKSQTAPKIFQNEFHKPIHKYPTNLSASNYSILPFKWSNSKYRISIRGFMHKIKSQIAPNRFQNKFHKPTHKYPTNFSTSNYSTLSFKWNNSKYRISIRGPTLWKNIPTNSEKMQESVNIFQTSMRKKLLELFKNSMRKKPLPLQNETF